jgi:hypothetical protein
VCGECTSRLHRETDCITHLKWRIDDLEKKLQEAVDWIESQKDVGK